MGLSACGIPDDRLPPCWSDDVRMNALFAPFRLKSTNLESWNMKMKFWSDMLRQWCKYRKDPIVSVADAKVAFQRKGRTPACLDIVIEEMFKSSEFCPVSKYYHILQNGPEGWVQWGARLAFKHAVYAITTVSTLLPARQALDSDGLPKASIDSNQRFVLESAIKEQAMELLENYPEDMERMGSIDEIMKNSRFQQSREIFELLLGWLVSQGLAVKKGDIIKLAGDVDKKASPVSQADEALVKLISAEKKLEVDAARSTRDVESAETDARAALQMGNRIAAKNHLRRKHKISQRLERCTSALENVRLLIQQMKDHTVTAALVDTYKTSSEAMKRGIKEGGLEEDSVHDTMDDLKEVMDTYNEVEKALGATVDDFDAAELEQELKDLLAGPGAPGGGTPDKEKEAKRKPHPLRSAAFKKVSERDFIFDGEARMLAELDELDFEDSSPKERKEQKVEKKKIAVAENWKPVEKPKDTEDTSTKPSKSWYPPSEECLQDSTWRNNNPDDSLKRLSEQYGEVRMDDRLHPGQPLNVDFTTPPKHYNTDFQVRDHKPASGVWLFNSKDQNSNMEDFAQSTEYFSAESPGKSGGSFQMAPGGERDSVTQWASEEASMEDLERRLKKLRSLNL